MLASTKTRRRLAKPRVADSAVFLLQRTYSPASLQRLFSPPLNITRFLERALQPLAILCYVDAAHAVHPDKKSQSGACFGLGISNVHWSTSGVKMNTRSTTKQNFTLLAKMLLTQFLHQEIWMI